jgi:hypothetical protein
MGLPVFAVDVVDVVGGDELEAELRAQGIRWRLTFCLFGDAVILQFEVEVLGPEDLLEPVDAVPG